MQAKLDPTDKTRRSMLWMVPAVGVALLASTASLAQEAKEQFEVTPAEDLMREHGLLKRILLIYDEAGRRISAKQDFSPDVLSGAAKIIQTFIEKYHEKLEEDHLFPRFRQKHVLVELVDTLQTQHAAGRRVTDQILALCAGRLKAEADKEKLATALKQFVRMYAPHEAREDTVLFPALHTIISRHEYDALGEEFEKKEHQMFGKEGFEGMVPKVAQIEQEFGIYDLNQFTPR
jgi:hemerythrin-like domain-containing protein